MAIGVDGCHHGWVAVRLDRDGYFDTAAADASLARLLPRLGSRDTVGIDMPIHLMDAGRRESDLAARDFLGGIRGRSVFAAPPAFTLEPSWQGKTHHEVNLEMRRRYGIGLSRQTFALCPKILQINALLGNGLDIHEVHPEVSFAEMNEGKPMQFSKKSWGGQEERLSLLALAGIRIPKKLPKEVAAVPPDDIIDACVAAWSARRIAHGQAHRFPGTESEPATIWA